MHFLNLLAAEYISREKMHNYKEKIVKGTFTVLMIGLVGTVLGYLLRIYLARNLSIQEFGLFYSVLAFLYFFGLFKDIGLGQAVTKFVSEFDSKKDPGKIKSAIYYPFIIQFFIGAAITVFLYVFSDFIATNFFHEPGAKIIIQIMSIEFFIGFVILKSVLQGLHKVSYYALIEPVRLALIWCFAFFLIGAGAGGIALSYLASAIIINAGLIVYVFKIYRSFGKAARTASVAWSTLRFGITVFVGNVASVLISSVDVLAITFFLSVKDVGLYQAAMPTANLLLVFSSALSIVLLPSASAIWSSEKKQALGTAVSLIMKALLIFIMPFAIIMITFPEIIMNFIFGNSYIIAAPLLQILSIGAIFSSLWSIMLITLLGIGKPEITTKIVIMTACVNLVLNVILVNLIGVYGAAISTSVSYIIVMVITYRLMRKYIKVYINPKDVAKVFLGSILSVMVIFAIKGVLVTNEIVEAAAILVIGLVVYAAFILLSRAVIKSDIKILTEIDIKMPKFMLKFLYRIEKE